MDLVLGVPLFFYGLLVFIFGLASILTYGHWEFEQNFKYFKRNGILLLLILSVLYIASLM